MFAFVKGVPAEQIRDLLEPGPDIHSPFREFVGMGILCSNVQGSEHWLNKMGNFTWEKIDLGDGKFAEGGVLIEN